MKDNCSKSQEEKYRTEKGKRTDLLIAKNTELTNAEQRTVLGTEKCAREKEKRTDFSERATTASTTLRRAHSAISAWQKQRPKREN